MRPYKKFLTAIAFTFVVGFVTWFYSQYIACLLGIVTGLLRIKLFWVSDEGEPFVEHEIELPRPERPLPVQTELVHDHQVYVETSKKAEFWRKPLGFLALAFFVFAVVMLDKRMIFYTFLMTMLTTWMWFQWWIERKIYI